MHFGFIDAEEERSHKRPMSIRQYLFVWLSTLHFVSASEPVVDLVIPIANSIVVGFNVWKGRSHGEKLVFQLNVIVTSLDLFVCSSLLFFLQSFANKERKLTLKGGTSFHF